MQFKRQIKIGSAAVGEQFFIGLHRYEVTRFVKAGEKAPELAEGRDPSFASPIDKSQYIVRTLNGSAIRYRIFQKQYIQYVRETKDARATLVTLISKRSER